MDLKREAPAPLAGGSEGKTKVVGTAEIASAARPCKPASDAFPIVIAEWERNAREIVRVALDQYNGRCTINVRVWFRDEGGALRPGKSGITLGLKHLPALAEALQHACQSAENLGFLDGGAS